MIRRKNEARIDHVDNLAGGNGTISLNHLVEDGELCGAGKMFAMAVLPPGGSVGSHGHVGEYEIYYIVKGKALVHDNGTEAELLPGDTHVCKDGDSHAIENIGECDLEFIAAIFFTK